MNSILAAGVWGHHSRESHYTTKEAAISVSITPALLEIGQTA
jgi:hypothetical protein